MSSGPTNEEILVHEYGQTICWIILVNVNIILAQLRYNRAAAFTHMVIGLSIFFLTYFFILWYMIPYGFIQGQELQILDYLHAIIGCAMFGFIVLIATSGMFTRLYRDSSFSRSIKKGVRIFHIYFTYLIVVMFKINALWNWYGTYLTTFGVLLAWQLLSLIVWIYLKFFTGKLERIVLDMRIKFKPMIKIIEIKHTKDLLKSQIPYVIYNNYVYDATQVMKHHPGGIKVIQTILGREIDRFLYGMYSSELCPEVLPYSHSVKALALLRQPIMKIVTPPPYNNFIEDQISVKVQFMSEVSKRTKIYVFGLVKTMGELDFTGYSDVKQLGQYYSFTMNKKMTRLYTTVNFLTRQNIALLNELIPNLKYNLQEDASWKIKRSDLTELQKINSKKQKLFDENSLDYRRFLPIMLKVYETGKFTSALFNADFNKDTFQLSPPKGLGLELEVTKPGKIVIVAGGTGLFPFSDLIDLIFKSIHLTENKSHHEEILEKNPILKSKPFQKFKFVLLAAINQPEDLHPITYSQLISLNSHPSQFKTVLRVSKNQQELKKVKSDIEFTRDYFTSRVITESAVDDFSRIWICGPPKMSTELAQTLLQSGFKRGDFLLL